MTILGVSSAIVGDIRNIPNAASALPTYVADANFSEGYSVQYTSQKEPLCAFWPATTLSTTQAVYGECWFRSVSNAISGPPLFWVVLMTIDAQVADTMPIRGGLSNFGVQVEIDSNYALYLYIQPGDGSAGTRSSTLATISSSAVVKIGVKVILSDATHIQAQLYVDGTAQGSALTVAFTSGTPKVSRVACSTPTDYNINKGDTWDFRFARVVADDTQLPSSYGALNVELLLPDGDVTQQWFEPDGVTAGTYTEWDDPPGSVNTATYNQSPSLSIADQHSTLSNSGAGVVTTLAVQGWYYRQWSLLSGIATRRMVLDDGSASSLLPNDNNPTQRSVGNAIWTVPPSGGAWAPAVLNALKLGLHVGSTSSICKCFELYALHLYVENFAAKSLFVRQAVNRAATY